MFLSYFFFACLYFLTCSSLRENQFKTFELFTLKGFRTQVKRFKMNFKKWIMSLREKGLDVEYASLIWLGIIYRYNLD
jgi:hypothetical protein